MLKKTKNRIYLDFASSTPVDKKMMLSYKAPADAVLGANPNALHIEGVTAKKILEDARKKVAGILSAHTDEIIFTSGATESNTLALVGSVIALKQKYPEKKIHIVVSGIEHPSVALAIENVKNYDVSVTSIIPDENGVIDPKHIYEALTTDTVLVSCMYVQNEIGTVQPIKEIAKIIRRWKGEHENQEILFHCDATQAAPYLSLNILQLHTDLLTIGSSKLYGPKGVGVLFKSRAVNLAPIHFGGNYEFGLRPGTPPVALIDQFAFSFAYAIEIQEKELVRLKELRDFFEKEIASISGISITAKNTERLPTISHIAVPGIDSELLVIELDARGIAVSSKSACKNEESNNGSIVSFIYPGQKNLGILRFSFGRMTTKKDLEVAFIALKDVLKKYNILV